METLKREFNAEGVALLERALQSEKCNLDYPFADQVDPDALAKAMSPTKPDIRTLPLATSLAAIWGIIEGSFYMTFPLVVIGLLSYGISLTVLAVILVVGIRDEMVKRACGWKSKVRPGLYFEQTAENQRVLKHWAESKRAYKPPWWCWMGDLSTVVPFILNEPVKMKRAARLWLRVDDGDDDEAVALDWFFPSNKSEKLRGMVLLLHGLNGGSDEAYIQDYVVRSVSRGYTCAVMISRGMGSTPVKGAKYFHAARLSDCCAALDLLNTIGVPFHAVGYSLGGVVISNAIATLGPNAPSNLRSAVALSGAADMRVGAHAVCRRSRRVWQPVLVLGLLQNLESFGMRWRHVPTPRTVMDLDEHLIAPYFGFGSGNAGLLAYYTAASAAAESAPCSKLMRVHRPLLWIHACDDPIVPVDQFEEALKTPAAKTWYLITAQGGHVGWPIGSLPWLHGWKWMSDVTLSFIEANDASAREVSCSVSGAAERQMA